MAGVSRGCWPAQGGLLPGLMVASITELVVVVCRGLGAGKQSTDQLAKLSSSSQPHLESKDLKRFLGADWTQADVHFKDLWLQRTSAGCVWGLCQSFLETDTLAESRPGPDDHTIDWPQRCILPWRSRNRPWSKFKGSVEVLPKFFWWGSSISTPDAIHCYFQFKMSGFKESSKWVILASLKRDPLRLLVLAVWFWAVWYSPLCFFHYFVTSEYSLEWFVIFFSLCVWNVIDFVLVPIKQNDFANRNASASLW